MAKANLNAEHIQLINAAMSAAKGNMPEAARILREDEGWEGWMADKLRRVIERNSCLRDVWLLKENAEDNVVAPPEEAMTSIYRPEIPMVEMEGKELPDSLEDRLLIGSLEQHEEEYRNQLLAMGESDAGASFMIASGKLQSQFALCTLNSLTGSLVNVISALRARIDKTMQDLDSLLAVAEPVEKALLVDREKVLRDYHVQLVELIYGGHDRVTKAFFLQMEARKHERENRKGSRPKRMLGITAMPGSRPDITVNLVGGNVNGKANGH